MAYNKDEQKIKIYDGADWMAEPNQLATNAEKDSVEYGLSVGKKIEGEWFYRSGSSARFYDKREEYERLRLYARGEQGIEDYKKRFEEEDGDFSYLNLDWELVSILPKFVDIIANGMQDRSYKVKAKAIDPFASAERDRYKQRLRGEMENYAVLNQMKQATGVDTFENAIENIPTSEEELEVRLELDYKQSMEVAAETAVDYILELNNYNEEVRMPMIKDLITIGIAAGKTSFNVNDGVTVDYIDPLNLIHSYTDRPNFEDCYYFGEVKSYSIATIHKMFPDLDAEDLEEIKEIGEAYNRYQGVTSLNYKSNDYSTDPNLVHGVTFYWKTTNTVVHKIGKNRNSGTEKAILKDETFNPPKDDRVEKVVRTEEVIYEGFKILGDDARILKWGKAKNMVRKSSSSVNVQMPIVVSAPNYEKGRIDSIVKRSVKATDLIQITHLKLQQAIQRMTPSGVYLDADGLAEIDLGNGTSYNPAEALKMYFQTGSVIGRSMTVDGDPNGGKVPIQELNGGSGDQIPILINAYNFYLDQIRQVTGVNEIREGQKPDERALVGVQKLAAANSNTATRHILDAGLYITERLSDSITLRMKDIFEFAEYQNPQIKKSLVDSIGESNALMIEDLNKMHLHDFGIFLELAPDAEEMAVLEQNIQQALAKDQIYLEDAIDVREVKNIKLANKLLSVRRKKKQLLEQQQQQQAIQSQARANAQSAQAAEQAKAQTMQIETQGKAQLLALQHQNDMRKLQAEKLGQQELMQFEFQLNQQAQAGQFAHADRQLDKKGQNEMAREQVKQKQKAFESIGNDSKLDGNLKDRKFGPS